jgi:hypothetical protein
VLLAVVGCTGDANTQRLEVPFAPLLMTYRVAGGPWQTPQGTHADDGGTSYELRVDGDFEIVVVCSDPFYGIASLTVEVLGMQQDFGGVGFWPCPATSTAPTATVTGELAQAGRVDMNGSSAESTASEVLSYQLTVPRGLSDFVATDTTRSTQPTRIAIRHDQSIEADFVEPVLDLTTAGAEIQDWEPTVVGGESGDIISVSTVLLTKNGTSAGLGLRGAIVPASQLETGDEHWLLVEVLDPADAGFRSVSARFTQTPQTTYTLLPRLSGVSFDQALTSISWVSLPEGYGGATAEFTDQHNAAWVTASRSWLARYGDDSLSVDTAVPGLDPWKLGPVLGGLLFVSAYQASDDGSSVTYETNIGVGTSTRADSPRGGAQE